MKKLRIKKWVKMVLLGLAFIAVLASIGTSLDKVGLDELGNTCYGNFIKVCGE